MSFQWVWAYVPPKATSMAPPEVILPLPHPYGTVLSAPMPPPRIPKRDAAGAFDDGMPPMTMMEKTPMTPGPEIPIGPMSSVSIAPDAKGPMAPMCPAPEVPQNFDMPRPKSWAPQPPRVPAPPPTHPGPLADEHETVVVEDENEEPDQPSKKPRLVQPRPKRMPTEKETTVEAVKTEKTEKTEKETRTKTISKDAGYPWHGHRGWDYSSWSWDDDTDWNGGNWSSWKSEGSSSKRDTFDSDGKE